MIITQRGVWRKVKLLIQTQRTFMSVPKGNHFSQGEKKNSECQGGNMKVEMM